MTDRLPLPSYQVSHIRHAHIETDRGSEFAALLDRLVSREAERDLDTGLTAAEAAAEQAYRSRSRSARRLRIESPHNPLLGV